MNFLPTAVEGFVRFASGFLVVLNAPVTGQQGTYPQDVNEHNVFSGCWFNAGGRQHGFMALAVP
jgi:hypothetical protein